MREKAAAERWSRNAFLKLRPKGKDSSRAMGQAKSVPTWGAVGTEAESQDGNRLRV